MSSASPTAMSMKYLREMGFHVHRAEYWNSFSMKRVDAFTFGDLLICHPLYGIYLIQVTTAANMSARTKKILGVDAAKAWLQSGGHITVHGWAKRGPKGKRKVWQIFAHEIKAEDFEIRDAR